MSAILTMWIHPHHAPSATSYPLIEFLILVCKFMHSILLWTSLSMYWLKWHRKQHKHINGNDGDDATAYHWEMEDFYFTNICESTGNHNIVTIYSSSNYCIFSVWHLCDELYTTFISTFLLDLVHWGHFFASW